MPSKKKLIFALVIVIATILFVVLNPKALESFLTSFNDAYNHASEKKMSTEEVVDDGWVSPVLPDVRLEVVQESEGGYVLHIMPDIFKFVPPGETLEEGWGGHMLVYLRKSDAEVVPPLAEAEFEKQYTAYSDWVYLEGLETGAYQMRVLLVDTNNQIIAVEDGPGDFFYSLDFTIPLSN